MPAANGATYEQMRSAYDMTLEEIKARTPTPCHTVTKRRDNDTCGCVFRGGAIGMCVAMWSE